MGERWVVQMQPKQIRNPFTPRQEKEKGHPCTDRIIKQLAHPFAVCRVLLHLPYPTYPAMSRKTRVSAASSMSLETPSSSRPITTASLAYGGKEQQQ